MYYKRIIRIFLSNFIVKFFSLLFYSYIYAKYGLSCWTAEYFLTKWSYEAIKNVIACFVFNQNFQKLPPFQSVILAARYDKRTKRIKDGFAGRTRYPANVRLPPDVTADKLAKENAWGEEKIFTVDECRRGDQTGANLSLNPNQNRDAEKGGRSCIRGILQNLSNWSDEQKKIYR